MHIVVVQIFAHAFEAVRAFLNHRRVAGERLEGLNQIQQHPFCASGSSVCHRP
jgi:hypothetical protein